MHSQLLVGIPGSSAQCHARTPVRALSAVAQHPPELEVRVGVDVDIGRTVAAVLCHRKELACGVHGDSADAAAIHTRQILLRLCGHR